MRAGSRGIAYLVGKTRWSPALEFGFLGSFLREAILLIFRDDGRSSLDARFGKGVKRYRRRREEEEEEVYPFYILLHVTDPVTFTHPGTESE